MKFPAEGIFVQACGPRIGDVALRLVKPVVDARALYMRRSGEAGEADEMRVQGLIA